MPIKASSARQVDELIADLSSDDAVTRDAAIARLMIVGPRAVDRLTTLAGDAAAATIPRAAAFRALEGIPDSRALAAAVDALHRADDPVALAALAVVRAALQGDGGIAALDALTTVALARQRSEAVREAAVGALEALDSSTRGPLMDALLTDPSPRLRALGQGMAVETTDAAFPASWLDSPETRPLPPDPDLVRHEIARLGATIDLPRLHQAIERIRDREQEATASERRRWLAARAAAHVALAQRRSRLALYDLREILTDAAQPLPSALLEAVAAIGDVSCLEPLADLYTRTVSGPPVDAWQRQMVTAFHAVMAREGISSRHAVAKRIKMRAPETWTALGATRPPRASQ